MVQASTQSPTVDSHFTLVATRIGGPGSSTADVPLEVQPVYDVFLQGGASPETWDATPVGTPAMFAPHAEGVTVNFHNMDTASNHIIHGTGIITHQNTAQPLTPSPGGGVPGGVYSLKFMQTAQVNGTFYCHTHESSAVARQLQLNRP